MAGAPPLRARCGHAAGAEKPPASDDQDKSEPPDNEGFREFARFALDEFGPAVHNGTWDAFARNLSYSDADEEAPALAVAVERAERELGGEPRRLHYLSVPPAASAGIVRTCGAPASPSERA